MVLNCFSRATQDPLKVRPQAPGGKGRGRGAVGFFVFCSSFVGGPTPFFSETFQFCASSPPKPANLPYFAYYESRGWTGPSLFFPSVASVFWGGRGGREILVVGLDTSLEALKLNSCVSMYVGLCMQRCRKQALPTRLPPPPLPSPSSLLHTYMHTHLGIRADLGTTYALYLGT